MKQQRYQYHKYLFVIACITFVFTIVIRANLTKGEQADIPDKEKGSDLITTDTLRDFGPVETIKFDKRLHDLHSEMTGKECSSCHHIKGKEVSCRRCHKETDRKKLISMKNASHLSCIGCHREMSGPVDCNECHKKSIEEKNAMHGNGSVSTQAKPDFMHDGIKHPNKHRGVPVNKMGPVRFDHDIHREFLDKCDIPVRTGSGLCAQTCHTSDGSKQGKMITTDYAMHEIDNKKGCVGCHEDEKKNRGCAGCHGVMERGKNLNTICLKCHMESPESRDSRAPNREIPSAMHHASQKPVFEEISDEDIPEKVIIDKLSSQYGAVELPHRKIIESLMSAINNNKLAMGFHNGKETICLGCHHNSPKGKTLSCDNCHNRSSDGQDFSMPALSVAYHQQCIGCHDRMDIELPGSAGCVDCHKVIEAETK